MRLPLTPLVVIALAAALVPAPAASAQASMEAEILSLINAGRRSEGLGPLSSHAGLNAQARGHARAMAQADALGHSGAAGRIASAAPDPAEPNGAPDDGFTLHDWCENVGYVENASEAEIPEHFYRTWVESASHADCMFDAPGRGITVGGVGLYKDANGRWWATFTAVDDSTRPGRAQRRAPDPTPQPTAAPRPAPASDAPSAATRSVPAVTAAAPSPTLAPTPVPTSSPAATAGVADTFAAPATIAPRASGQASTGTRIAAVWGALAVVGGLLAALLALPARRRARRAP